MKSSILVMVCILSCCQAIPLDGSDAVIINNKTEQIPEPTFETTTNDKNSPEKIVRIGPFVTQKISTIPDPTTTPEPTTTPTSNPTTNATTTTPNPTPTTSITTTQQPTPTTHVPTTTKPSTPPTSTEATTTQKPTARPSTQPIVSTTPTIPTNRGFDGPSFIGGIVLAAGLMAIGFVAFKFYRARTELNYHTL